MANNRISTQMQKLQRIDLVTIKNQAQYDSGSDSKQQNSYVWHLMISTVCNLTCNPTVKQIQTRQYDFGNVCNGPQYLTHNILCFMYSYLTY